MFGPSKKQMEKDIRLLEENVLKLARISNNQNESIRILQEMFGAIKEFIFDLSTKVLELEKDAAARRKDRSTGESNFATGFSGKGTQREH